MTETRPPESPVFRTTSVPPEDTLARLGPDEVAARLFALQHVTDAALAHDELDVLLEALLERVLGLLDVDSVRILLGSAPGRDLTVCAALGLEEGPGAAPVTVPLGRGVAGWVARQAKGAIVDDLARVDTADPALRRLQAAMAAPMLVEGALVGVLEVGTRSARRFRDADLALLQMVADRVGLAVARARRHAAAPGAGRGLSGAEQQRLMEELQTGRHLLEAVLEQMPAGVVIVEAPSGRVLRGNSQLVEILGHEVHASTGVEEYGAWMGVRPDGIPVGPHDWPVARAMRDGEIVSGEEVLYARGDGSRRWIRISAVPVRDAQGQIVAGVAVLHDIHQEKQAAEEMRFLAEVSSTLHSTLDHHITLRKVARLAVPFFADWCAVDLVDQAGRHYRQEPAHHDPDREALMRELQRAYPAQLSDAAHPIGRAMRTGEAILIREIPDRLVRDLAADEGHLEKIRALGLRSVIVAPLRGRERMLGAITFATAESRRVYDAHDLALAEEIAQRSAIAIENAQLYAAANEADRAKTDFLAVMSHELRTPLAAIMGYAELLQMGIPVAIPEGALHQVERIDASARHQLQLIEEILTFSRLNAGQEVVVRSRVDLTAPVHDAVAFIRPAAERKGLALRVDVPPGPHEVETDAGKVRQVLINLLFNAVQFTQKGEVGIALEPRPEEVRIRVHDTGIGVATEHLGRIFDPFWQVRQSSTREVGGTGLGLTVAQRTAQILGGDIGVASELGRGSTFTLHLPLAPPGGSGRAAGAAG